MQKNLKTIAPVAMLMLLSACSLVRCAPEPLQAAELDRIFSQPLEPPDDHLSVFYIGHSLIGRDMPAMVQQLAGDGHVYDLQLGWGTTLKEHWEPDLPIKGFEHENDHPRYRDAGDAVDSGQYDVLVLTEMVEIRDAIRYFDSWDYLARWARRGWQGNARMRVYLYETWHPIDDPEGWLNRLDRDLSLYWEGEILARSMAAKDARNPIYVIPAGQVLARFVREVELRGGVGEVQGIESLFAVNAEGEQDKIHFSDLGAYLVALTHYAVLYHRSPVGLPMELKLADGSVAVAPSPAVAQLMQNVVWEVVTTYPKTGVAQQGVGARAD